MLFLCKISRSSSVVILTQNSHDDDLLDAWTNDTQNYHIVVILKYAFAFGELRPQCIFHHDGNFFGSTGHLWAEFAEPNIPRIKASDAELWCFYLICAWINGLGNNRDAGDLIRHRAHYKAIIMQSLLSFSWMWLAMKSYGTNLSLHWIWLVLLCSWRFWRRATFSFMFKISFEIQKHDLQGII